MIGIKEYLKAVTDDFDAYLCEEPLLCQLKKVNFDQGQLPDYSDLHIQQLYLLRYAYSYAFEYYTIYKKILSVHNYCERGSVSIASIGCGNGIDYWGMARALEDYHESCTIRYRGNDIIEWNYWIPKRDGDSVEFIQNDIGIYSEFIGVLDSDIYIFPKSISEFGDSDIDKIVETFQNKKIEKDRIFLAISMRANEFSMSEDKYRVEKIVSAIVRNDYDLEHDSGYVDFGTDVRIEDANAEFSYPGNRIFGIIANLNKRCSNFVQNGCNCKEDCKEKLTRKPISRTKYIRYRAICFRRKV